MVDGYTALSPWVIGFSVFYLVPVLATFYLSFTQWTLVGEAQWVGIENYRRMFTEDPLFLDAARATVLFVLFSLPAKLALGLALALLLNLKLPGMNFFRTVFFLPAVISGVAVSLMWVWFLQPDTGVVNTLLRYVGIAGPHWFWDADWALFSVALMSIWKVGGAAIIYLAGLQNIPAQLYEAASMDGANSWQKFRRITLPLLTPTLFFQLIIEMIDAFKIFTEAVVITKGGPLNQTYFFLYYFYEEAFTNFNMGYASALAIFLLTVIMTSTALAKWWANKWVYYGDQN
ncbi:sugar ABC transporter permease [Agrobacterium rhizogenes]|uniref:carbohydrate ABC transporter permease n=1 Tax=Rhizobium rhizogenes TaxID=359 RepID=UPI0022B5F1F0|nr:sugar ABC transporter permease [Rhizobium rhizogenes]MCZ7447269.1 sugar ABC transporter permease [Rhizobium rhizogenes]